MLERYPIAFWISLAMHIGMAAALLFFVYNADQFKKQEEPIFELVAAPGDNFVAAEAPQGNPAAENISTSADIAEIEFPDFPPLPQPNVAEVIPESEPPPAPKEPPRISVATKSPPKTVQQQKRPTISKEEFERLYKNKRPKRAQQQLGRSMRSSGKAVKIQRIDAAGILNGSKDSRTGAGGNVLRREKGNEVEAYFQMLVRRLRAAHEKPRDVSDLLSAELAFRVNSDGRLTEIRIIRSSGNAEFDRTAMDSFGKIAIVAPPAGAIGVHSLVFKMREDG